MFQTIFIQFITFFSENLETFRIFFTKFVHYLYPSFHFFVLRVQFRYVFFWFEFFVQLFNGIKRHLGSFTVKNGSHAQIQKME